MAESSSPIGQEFCADKSLRLTKNNGGFTATDVDNKVMFTFTLNGPHILCNAAKHSLRLTLHHNGTSKGWKVFRTDKELFSVIKKSARFDVFLAKDEEKDVCDFNIQGNWGEPTCIICRGDSQDDIIAWTEKTKNNNKIMTVSATEDCAFIVALVAVLET